MARLWSHSLLVRLTTLFSLAALVALVLLGLVIVRATANHFAAEDYRILSHQIDMIEYDLKKMVPQQDLRQQVSEILNRHGVLARISTDAGNVFTSPGMPPLDVSAWQRPDRPLLSWQDPQTHTMYRAVQKAFSTQLPSFEHGKIFTAIDISHHEAFLASFHRTMWILIGVTVLCIGVSGWVAARIVLRPLQGIVRQTAKISAENLSLRIPVTSVPPDMQELVQTFNAMLDKLEASFRRLSEFSHDLAHELRTPLSTMKVQTQVTLSSARTADEYRDVLQSNAEELDHLSRMVDNILYIAKTENGLEAKDITCVDLEEEFLHIFDYYEMLAESNNIQLVLTGKGRVAGDKTMLRRAFSNMLSNAIKYSEASGTIAVQLQQDVHHTVIRMTNYGETIAPEHLPHLFDRFYRARGSARHRVDGTGLGLAITRAIIHAHGGTIAVQSAQGETIFTIALPREGVVAEPSAQASPPLC